jgi:hypothetical protein
MPVHESQEMDWDYGVYLPVDVWENNGPPAEMAPAYFHLVERLLEPLCRQKQWKLIEGPNRKDTCIRIQISTWAHIDLPLYAAPQAEFAKVHEAALIKNFAEARDLNVLDSIEMGQEWDDMEGIMMATRKGHWRESDPEAVKRWFDDRLKENGEQLRRVCCYLKAFRDFHWEKGGPSSVAIMIAIAEDFKAFPGRDDKALLEAARCITEKIMTDLPMPAICTEGFNNLDVPGRIEARDKFLRLVGYLKSAMGLLTHEKVIAVQQVTLALGPRIPQDVSLIEPDNIADAVRQTKPNLQVKPIVFPTISG